MVRKKGTHFSIRNLLDELRLFSRLVHTIQLDRPTNCSLVDTRAVNRECQPSRLTIKVQTCPNFVSRKIWRWAVNVNHVGCYSKLTVPGLECFLTFDCLSFEKSRGLRSPAKTSMCMLYTRVNYMVLKSVHACGMRDPVTGPLTDDACVPTARRDLAGPLSAHARVLRLAHERVPWVALVHFHGLAPVLGRGEDHLPVVRPGTAPAVRRWPGVESYDCAGRQFTMKNHFEKKKIYV